MFLLISGYIAVASVTKKISMAAIILYKIMPPILPQAMKLRYAKASLINMSLAHSDQIIHTYPMLELSFIQKIVIWALPVIFAITLHEVAHGWVASCFGDQTARLSGRLTLNPLKHIDLFGTVLLPILLLMFSNFIFGWAKPVPVDPRNLHHPRRDMAFVAFAGPCANLLMALFWGAIAKIGAIIGMHGNAWVGIPLTYMGEAGIMINVILAVLNLIPLPPLDGSKVIIPLLPKRSTYYFMLLEPYGFFILILLMITGGLSYLLSPPVFLLINGISRLYGLM